MFSELFQLPICSWKSFKVAINPTANCYGLNYALQPTTKFMYQSFTFFYPSKFLAETLVQFSSVTQLCPTLCDPMDCMQHARPPCPSPSPGAYSNSCPSSQWCYLTISSSDTVFSFCLQSFPATGSFPVSQLFELGGQSTGASASASVLSMNVQGWFPLEFTRG